jgi:site-specific recombinase XerD
MTPRTPRTAVLADAPQVDEYTRTKRDFADELQIAGKQPQTITVYMKALNQLHAYLIANNLTLRIADLTTTDLRGYFAGLSHRGLTDSTRAQHYRSLQQWFKFLVREKLIAESPLARITAPKIRVNPPPVLTDDEVNRLIKTCRGTSLVYRRDEAIISLLYDTGMRRAEIAGIRLKDIDERDHTIEVTGKGARTRRVPYSAEMSRVLTRYLRERDKHRMSDSEWLWLGERGPITVFGIEQMIRRRGDEAGVPGMHTHRFRHAFADRYLASGGAEGDLMRLAGWSSRSMLDRYGAANAAERARRNYTPHSPLANLKKSETK